MYCLFLKKMNRGSAFFKVVSLIIYIYKKNPKSYTNALCHYSVQARTYKKFYKHTKTKKNNHSPSHTRPGNCLWPHLMLNQYTAIDLLPG